jgi:hypothetical protein
MKKLDKLEKGWLDSIGRPPRNAPPVGQSTAPSCETRDTQTLKDESVDPALSWRNFSPCIRRTFPFRISFIS